MSKVTTKAKLEPARSCATPRLSRRLKSIRLMFDNGRVEYMCGRKTDSAWYSLYLVPARLILHTVPRVLGTGPIVSRNPARVSECRYRALISLGKMTGPQVKVVASV